MSLSVHGWIFRVVSRKPWRSITFTGDDTRFAISPPAGLIIAEARIEPDGTLRIMTVDDVSRDLVRVEDAAEAERFRLECERDLKGEDQ